MIKYNDLNYDYYYKEEFPKHNLFLPALIKKHPNRSVSGVFSDYKHIIRRGRDALFRRHLHPYSPQRDNTSQSFLFDNRQDNH